MSEEREQTRCGTDGGRKEGGIAIPSLSDIKKANRVPVITTQPTLFNRIRHGRPEHGGGDFLVPPGTETTTQSSCGVLRGHCDVPNGVKCMNEEQPAAFDGSRKRTREEKELAAEIPPKRVPVATNERNFPQHENNHPYLQSTAENSANASTFSSTGKVPSHTQTSSDGSAVFAGNVMSSSAPVSRGLASAVGGTSTAVPTVHHPHAIIANPVQKKNPVMRHIRNVPWELGDVVPDFVLGKTTCAMFLSIRYHCLHPDYIHSRLKELGKQYQLRILLVLVDMKECQKKLQELAKIAILADLTLMLAWSYEEVGRYLETYKSFENKPPDMLMERIDSDFLSRATECLTTVKKVNKTDAATLLNNFKNLDKVITASRDELVLCPGLGPQKAKRLFTLFHQPFKNCKIE